MSEAELITVSKNEVLSRTAIGLPKYGAITEQRVVKDMQTWFKGFTFDEDLNITEMFKNVEQIEVFAKEAIAEINTADVQFKMDGIMKSGAIAVRRWYFGWIVNKVLSEASYGEGVAKKLSQSSGISDAYLYQYKDVGERLSITDVYTLGIYQASWDMIRQLATIKDEDYRKMVIQVYVNSITDVTNEVEIDNSRNAAILAIKKIKEGQKNPDKALDISNPAMLQQAASFREQAPEYDDADKAIEKYNKFANGIVKQQSYEQLIKACQDFFLMSDIIDAENNLIIFKGKVAKALSLTEKLENMLPVIKQELISLSNVTLTDPE